MAKSDSNNSIDIIVFDNEDFSQDKLDNINQNLIGIRYSSSVYESNINKNNILRRKLHSFDDNEDVGYSHYQKIKASEKSIKRK